jgi:hypothetical protein
MPRTVPADTLAALQEDYRQVQQLLEVDNGVDPAERYALGRDVFVTGGDVYQPRHFSVGGMKHGRLGAAGGTIVIDNRDSALSNIAYTNGWTGADITITWLVRNYDH